MQIQAKMKKKKPGQFGLVKLLILWRITIEKSLLSNKLKR